MRKSTTRSLLLPLLAGISTAAATAATAPTTGWQFVQNGTTGILALEAIIVSPTLALLFDLSGTDAPLQINNHSAWGALYDLETNKVIPLDVVSDTFCASGALLSNGSMVSVGGNFIPGFSTGTDGLMGVRIFEPCNSPDGTGCKLFDNPDLVHLAADRWYPSSLRIFDGSLLVVGGTHTFSLFYNTEPENTFEFFPAKDNGVTRPSPFLERSGPANMFPRVFALPDGTVFMVAGNQSIIYNVETKKETILPDIPGGVKVTNPFDGTAQLLPLSPPLYTPEVLVCGGSDKSDQIPALNLSSQDPASKQCSRITLTPAGIKKGWVVEFMPEGRMLPEMILLPTGEVVIINGGQTGYSAFSSVKDPVGNSNADHPNFTPTLYDPSAPLGQRMIKKGLPASKIARMYHSTVTLTPSGNLMIAGSNPNLNFTLPSPEIKYPTEFRVEHLNPPYMYLERPKLSNVPSKIAFNSQFTIQITLPKNAGIFPTVKVALMDLGFSSHAFHSSARLVWLDATLSSDHKTLHVTSPPNNRVYPPGPGYIYVTVGEYTSVGANVMVGFWRVASGS
ncbi:glyoxal oxidase N-terminus-domain-containing protein [Mycena amicta]|nr:glyoxal oxidase N-terminus-domain-containing protein [Mycena amicta]